MDEFEHETYGANPDDALTLPPCLYFGDACRSTSCFALRLCLAREDALKSDERKPREVE